MMVLLDPLPESFRTLQNPPKEIHSLGNEDFLTYPKVSIVGTRKPFSYTKKMTYLLAQKLKNAGICVVSGGAMGVDAIAHDGAFPLTIGVMANGLDIIYPKVNQNLIRKMQHDSLLLSEYAAGTGATRYSFVHRNRLVVALGEALVITQADENSGSMRSAEFALEMQKPIYVLPHRIGESGGTEKLLKENLATPLYDLDAFVAQYGDIHQENDPILNYFRNQPTLEEAIVRYGDKVYEYELDGIITIENGYINPSE